MKHIFPLSDYRGGLLALSVWAMPMLAGLTGAQAAEPLEFTPLPVAAGATFVELTGDGKSLLIAHAKEGTVTVWDIVRRAVERTLKVPDPSFLLCRDNRVYVASRKSATLHVYSTTNWELQDEVVAGGTDLWYLSAPSGGAFKGSLITTSRPDPAANPAPNQHACYLVDTNRDTRRLLLPSFPHTIWCAAYSSDGQIIATQDSRLTVRTFQADRFEQDYPEAAGSPPTLQRLGLFATTTSDGYWFGGGQAFAGMPLAPVNETSADLCFADRSLPLYYTLQGSTLTARLRARGVPEVGQVAIKPMPPLKVKTLDADPSRLQAWWPVAASQGGKLNLFIPLPAKGVVLAASLPAFDPSGVVVIPTRVVVGAPLNIAVASPREGTDFSLVNGPKTAKLSPDGKLAWTPSAAETGVNSFKLRSQTAAGPAFKRFEIEVVPKSIADKVGGNLDKLDDLGRIRLREESPNLITTRGGSEHFLLDGQTCHVLDGDGLTTLRTFDLPGEYKSIKERPGALLGLNDDKIDFLDKTTGKVTRSIPLQFDDPSSLACHPSAPLIYVCAPGPAAEEGDPLSRLRVYEVDETSGKSRLLPELIGNTVVIDPVAMRLYGLCRLSLRTGFQISPVTGQAEPRIRSIDWLRQYGLPSSGDPSFLAENMEPASAGVKMDFSDDGKSLAYVGMLGHAGTSEWKADSIPLYRTDNLKQPYASLTVGEGPRYLDFHPALDLLVAAAQEKIMFFKTSTGEALDAPVDFQNRKFTEVNLATFSLSGRYLLVAANFDQTGREMRAFPLRLSPEDSARIGAYRPPQPAAPAAAAKPAEVKPQTPIPAFTDAQLVALRTIGRTPMKTRDLTDRNMEMTVFIKADRGIGSGYFVSDSGHIMSCAHVIGNSKRVEVTHLKRTASGFDKVTVPAMVVSKDEELDIALLVMTERMKSKPVQMEPTKDLKPGESLLAIGNPGLGRDVLDFTVTQGIVSSPKREIQGQVYIQTSAAVNPGSSGGPLFNEKGNLVGMVVLKGGIEAAGFAIPSERLYNYIKERIAKPAK